MIKLLPKIQQLFKSKSPVKVLDNNTVYIPKDYKIIVEGDLVISSTGRIIIESGKGSARDVIHLNPQYDKNGEPIIINQKTIEHDDE